MEHTDKDKNKKKIYNNVLSNKLTTFPKKHVIAAFLSNMKRKVNV